MAPSLLRPPSQLSPALAMQLSQQAPAVLQSSPSKVSSSPLLAIFSAPETADLWLTYENLLLSCLRTGDKDGAHQCLERLENRFGNDNERVMALQGLAREAEATDDKTLQAILKDYDEVLEEMDTNIPVAKRRVALLRSLGRVSDAVNALIQLLDFAPTDAEAWAELADLYLSQGLYGQAIYALEEVLVLMPNAWNIHAWLGEVLYMAATASGSSDSSYSKYMAESVKRFSRSIELCNDYLRGYYGLKLIVSKLLNVPNKSAKGSEAEGFSLPDTATLQRLNELATSKLSEIVRRSSAGESGWQGYEENEITAARELIAKDTPAITR